jgi:hypothetical protein
MQNKSRYSTFCCNLLLFTHEKKANEIRAQQRMNNITLQQKPLTELGGWLE